MQRRKGLVTDVMKQGHYLRFQRDIASRNAQERMKLKMNAAHQLLQGKNFGIICPKYDGKMIRNIMLYLKNYGLNARYKKLHTKGRGFIGFKIFNN